MDHESVEILIPITLFAMVAAIVIVPRYFKSLERRKLADTVRAAIEKGQPLPPEVMGALTAADNRPPNSPERDLRRGVVLVAVALGLAGMGLSVGMTSEHARHALTGAAAIPGFVGLAFIVMWFLSKPRS
jgi:hypothetical protein